MNLRSFLAGITAAVMMMLALVAVAPAMADDQSCGAVIGMSVVRNTYHGSTLDTSGNVELIWHPGTTLGQWADPGATMWSNLRTENDCGDPTWATFGFDPSPVRRINGFSGGVSAGGGLNHHPGPMCSSRSRSMRTDGATDRWSEGRSCS